MNKVRLMYLVYFKYRDNYNYYKERERVIKCAIKNKCSYMRIDCAYFLEYQDAYRFWKTQRMAQRQSRIDPKQVEIDKKYIERYELKAIGKELDKIYGN